MVFHSRFFVGHTLARFFVFYHSLPVFVWLLVTSLKVALQFTFDLTSDIPSAEGTTPPAVTPAQGPAGAVRLGEDYAVFVLQGPFIALLFDPLLLLKVFYKAFVLGLLSLAVLITNNVYIRFLFDSLPFSRHEKMRKNFKGTVRLLYSSFRAMSLSRKQASNALKVLTAAVAVVPLACCALAARRLGCGDCSFFSNDPVPVLGAAGGPIDPARVFQDVRLQGGGGTHLYEPDGMPCAPHTEHEFQCDVVFKSAVSWVFVVFQWSVGVILSVMSRPNRRRKRGSAPHEKEQQQRQQQEPLPPGSPSPALQWRWSEADGPADDPDDAFRALNEVLDDDENFDYVVGDACYAGSILSLVYLVCGSLASDRGVFWGVTTYLVVASAVCCFYSFMWFFFHWVVSVRDAIAFVARWVARGSDADWADRRLVPVLLASVVGLHGALAQAVYGNALVTLLAVYCLVTLFPVVTFVLHREREWRRRRRRRRQRQHSEDRRRPSGSGSGAGGNAGAAAKAGAEESAPPSPTGSEAEAIHQLHLNVPFYVLDSAANSPAQPLSPAADESSPPTSDAGGGGAFHIRRRRPAPLRAGAEPPALAAPAPAPEAAAAAGTAAAAATPKRRRGGGRTRCVPCASLGRRPSEGVGTRLRYRVYMWLMLLLSALLAVVLLAVAQRLLLRPEDIPGQYRVIRPKGENRESALSVTMMLRDHAFASGHVLLGGADDGAGAAEADSHACSHRVHGLTLAQYAVLAQMPYLRSGSEDQRDYVATFLPDFEVVNASRAAGGSAPSRVAFYELYSARHDLSVVAVRGTTAFDFGDWLADIDIFLEAAAFQLFSRFLPGLGMWPVTVRSRVIQTISFALDALLPHERQPSVRHYYWPVLEHVRGVLAARPGRRVALAGHSLGGSVAKIVGAMAGLPAVSLAGPGIMDSRGKLGISAAAITRNVVNIHPSDDLISRVGSSGGTVVHTVCRDGRPDTCHTPFATVCSLVRECGYPGRPGMQCRFQRHTTVGESVYSALFTAFRHADPA